MPGQDFQRPAGLNDVLFCWHDRIPSDPESSLGETGLGDGGERSRGLPLGRENASRCTRQAAGTALGTGNGAGRPSFASGGLCSCPMARETAKRLALEDIDLRIHVSA